MKRVLVTGANGFIGRHSIEPLLSKGYDVHCVTSREPTKEESGVTWHQADLLSEGECACLFKEVRPSHLLHFAWYTKPGEYWVSEKNIDWVVASLHMLKNFKANGGERLTFAGTCAEYDWNYGFCSENVTPSTPGTFYGTCKNDLRQISGSFCKQNGISFSWGRIFFLYGPYEHPSRLVSSMIISLLKGEEAKCSHGGQIRDFIYSEDVASAFAALLNSNTEGTVNIASGEPVAISTIVNLISSKIGRPDLVRFGAVPVPADDPPMIVADTRRLNDEVGWTPEFDLEKGLNKAIEWWKERTI